MSPIYQQCYHFGNCLAGGQSYVTPWKVEMQPFSGTYKSSPLSEMQNLTFAHHLYVRFLYSILHPVCTRWMAIC